MLLIILMLNILFMLMIKNCAHNINFISDCLTFQSSLEKDSHCYQGNNLIIKSVTLFLLDWRAICFNTITTTTIRQLKYVRHKGLGIWSHIWIILHNIWCYSFPLLGFVIRGSIDLQFCTITTRKFISYMVSLL